MNNEFILLLIVEQLNEASSKEDNASQAPYIRK